MHTSGNVEAKYVTETEAIMSALVDGVDKIPSLAKSRVDSKLGSSVNKVRTRSNSAPDISSPEKRLRQPKISEPVPGFRIDSPDLGPTPRGTPRQRPNADSEEMDASEVPVPPHQ